MSESALILTQEIIDYHSFKSFITTIGGIALEENGREFVFSANDSSIWIWLQDRTRVKEYYEESDILEWERVLGGSIGTAFELKLDHTSFSVPLYLYLSHQMSIKWTVVLETIDEKIVDKSSLELMLREEGFSFRNNEYIPPELL